MPSTAASKTRRRCSSDRFSVSFASRTRSSAASVSARAASFCPSARRTDSLAWVTVIWFAMIRTATAITSAPMNRLVWTGVSPRSSPRTPVISSEPQAAITAMHVSRPREAGRAWELLGGSDHEVGRDDRERCERDRKLDQGSSPGTSCSSTAIRTSARRHPTPRTRRRARRAPASGPRSPAPGTSRPGRRRAARRSRRRRRRPRRPRPASRAA